MAIRYLTTGEVVAINEAEVGSSQISWPTSGSWNQLCCARNRPLSAPMHTKMCTARRLRSFILW